jgi:hypothetical protein
MDNEEITIRVNACSVSGRDKREEVEGTNPIPPMISHPYSTSSYSFSTSNMHSSLDTADYQECIIYKCNYNFLIGAGPTPIGPFPKRWPDFKREKEAESICHQGNPPSKHSIPQGGEIINLHNHVSMPAETLKTIIRAIGISNRPPAPAPPTTNRIHAFPTVPLRRPTPLLLPTASKEGPGTEEEAGEAPPPIGGESAQETSDVLRTHAITVNPSKSPSWHLLPDYQNQSSMQ